MSDVIVKELDNVKIVVLSEQGENHKKNGICNQDSYAFKVDNSGNYAFVVADGVGSCIFAKEGADKACEAVCDILSDCIDLSEDEIKQKIFLKWKSLIGKDWNDYGTTINFLYVYPERTVMGKIGDGAVIMKNGDNAFILSEETEFYTAETFAFGSSIYKHSFRVFSMHYDVTVPILLVLLTDGIEKELNPEKRREFLDYIDSAINNKNFVVELKNWILSLNNKNGDDKTIIICEIEGREKNGRT